MTAVLFVTTGRLLCAADVKKTVSEDSPSVPPRRNRGSWAAGTPRSRKTRDENTPQEVHCWRSRCAHGTGLGLRARAGQSAKWVSLEARRPRTGGSVGCVLSGPGSALVINVPVQPSFLVSLLCRWVEGARSGGGVPTGPALPPRRCCPGRLFTTELGMHLT